MPRMARVVVPGYPHHVVQRGNRRQRVFFSEDDYRYYRNLMAKACSQAKTDVWGYCLMPNHVHFVLVPQGEDGLRQAVAETHRRYTRRINLREGWRGHLWQERFHSCPMDETHLLATVRYAECNPVRAGLCPKPDDWPWSSAEAHLSGVDDGLVKVGPMLDRIGDWEAYLATQDSPALLEAVRTHARTGRPLGDEAFVDGIERIVGRTLRPAKAGRKPKQGGA